MVSPWIYFARQAVLILVVMEEGQRPAGEVIDGREPLGLNPCCNGRGSKTLSMFS